MPGRAGDLTALVDAFVLLFVAVDVMGVVPLYLGLTHRLSAPERAAVLRASILVGAGVSVAFALLGKAIFVAIGITVSDFKIAGGLILLGLAIRDLLGQEPMRGVAEGSDVGVVPLGVPLIVGPAVITTTIVLVDQHGPAVTVAALLANLCACWVVLAQAVRVERLLGRTGARALSKIVSLLLAAIGVQLVRQGLRG